MRLAIALLLGGCTGAVDTGEAPICPETCWAGLEGARVCAGGDDAGDGSAEAPFATVGAGLAAARASGGALLIGPGTWSEQLQLDAADAGLAIHGCEGTVLDATGVDGPVARFSGTPGAALTDVTLRGGRRALWVWQGATVTVERVRVEQSLRVGVIVHGADTRLDAVDLSVVDPVADDPASTDRLGYGVFVEDAVLDWTGGGVTGATGLGVFVRLKNVASPAAPSVLADLSVTGTAVDDQGRLGRGLMLQDLAQVEVEGGTYADNADAGIFGLRPAWLAVRGATVSGTRAAAIPGGGTSGDGVVVTRGSAATSPALYNVVVTGVTVSGSARAGLLFDGVTVAELAGNALADNLAGASALVQNGAAVGAVSDPTEELSGADVLGINDVEMDFAPAE